VQDWNALLRRGGGWMEFESFNPAVGRRGTRALYVQPLGNRLGVSCGMFKDS
jgi:hypothetical protein